MNQTFIKATSFALSLIFLFAIFLTRPVAAKAAETIDVVPIAYPRGGGTDTWGHPALHFMSGWQVSNSSLFTAKAVENKGMRAAYCVQPNVWLNADVTVPEILPENFLGTYYNGALTSEEIQQLLGRIFQYGYTGIVKYNHSDAELSEMIATQLLVWEVIVGERNLDFSHITPPVGFNRVIESIKAEHPLRTQIFEDYDRIEKAVQNHTLIPSFMNTNMAAVVVHEMVWDGTKYTVTLFDTNGVLDNFNFSSTTSGVSITKNGNSLTISTANLSTTDVDIQAKRITTRKAVTFWCSNKIEIKGDVQGLVFSGEEVSDTVNAYTRVKVSKGTLNIIKTTKNNNGQVSGFQFRVKKGGKIIGMYTTGDNGKISIPDLTAGLYTVEEMNLSDEFVQLKQNPIDIEVKGGQTATVNFENIKKLGVITVQKTNTNSEMGDYSLAGAEFTIKDQNGNIVDTIVTDKDGCGESKTLPLGNYTVLESKAPFGFFIDETIYTCTLSGSQGTGAVVYCPKIIVPNQPVMGKVTIEKMGEMLVGAEIIDDKIFEQYIPQYKTQALSGVVFDIVVKTDITAPDGTIIVKAGTVVDTVTTGMDGKAESKILHLGDYYAVERKTAYGMILDTSRYDFSLIYRDQATPIVSAKVNVYNERQKAVVSLEKYCEMPEQVTEDFNPYADILFGVFAHTDTLAADGTVAIPKDGFLEYITFDATGSTIIKTDLPIGSYYVQELQTGAGYVLDGQQYFFDFTYADQNTAIIHIKVNDGESIINNLQCGSLHIIKTFEGLNTPIAGVPFIITGTTVIGTTVEICAVTDENGEILLEDLLIGDYTVKEQESDSNVGYLLPDEQTVTVAHNEITELQIENKLIRGNVKLVKVDKDNNVTLSGAVFDLYDPSGKLLGNYTTNEDGEILIENLPYGFGYILSETKAASGYMFDKVKLSFDITENGKTIELSAVNEKIPPSDFPNTGDDGISILWITLMAVLAGAFVFTLTLRQHKFSK